MCVLEMEPSCFLLMKLMRNFSMNMIRYMSDIETRTGKKKGREFGYRFHFSGCLVSSLRSLNIIPGYFLD